MERSFSFRVLLGCLIAGSVLAAGCKKDEEDPATVPVPTAAAVTADPTTAEPAAAPSGDPSAAADAPSAAATAADPGAQAATPTPAAPVKKAGESIDACCSALRAIQKSGKTAIAKSKAAAAASICPGIAKLVKDGTTSRQAALSQIRSSMAGFDVPGECR